MEGIQRVWFQVKQKLLGNNRVRPFNQLLQFSDFFFCEKIFNLVGISFLNREISHIIRHRQFLRFVVGYITFVMIVTLISAVVTKDFLTRVENAAVGSCMALVLFEMFFIFWFKRDKIRAVIEILDKHFPHNPLNQHFYGTRKQFLFIKRICLLFTIFILTVSVIWCAYPVLVQIYALVSGTPQDLVLMFPWTLPFVDVNQHGPNEASILLQSLGIFCCNIVVQLDILYYVIVYLLKMEFDMVSENIKEIDFEYEEQAMEELKEQIKIQQQLLYAIDLVEDIFTILSLMTLVGAIVICCFFAFLCVASFNTTQFWKFSILFVGTSLHFTLFFYFPELLNRAAERFGEELYERNWEALSLKNQKIVMQVVRQAQRGAHLTACDFADMNLETLLWVIQTAYNYYSVLIALYRV